jgi:7-cyano-7-deazaguanine synthase
LTDANVAVPDASDDFRDRGIVEEQVPVTYVPFRNAHFLSAAVSWAEVLGATHVYIGAVEQDSSGYPDCRPAYYEAFQQVVRLGTRDGTIEIVTPLIRSSKAQIVQLGLECNAPLDLTWSCYREERQACGRCESCVLRLRAFQAAGVHDPITYGVTARITES